MSEFSHSYRNDEFEIDGAIIASDIRLHIDFAYDRNGPFFRRLTGASFVGPKDSHGAQVPAWLLTGLENWCRANEAKLNDRLADEVEGVEPRMMAAE